MKIKLITFMLSLGIFFSGCGIKQVNPYNSSMSKKFIDDQKYQEGYNDAIKNEKEKWVSLGYDRAKEIVKKFSNDILAYDAGKYAIKNNFVTYPKLVAATTSNGEIAIKSLGCDIRKTMSIDDIFHYYGQNMNYIPTIDSDNTPALKANDNSPTLQNVYSNSYQAPSADINVVAATSTNNSPIVTGNQVMPVKDTSANISLPMNQQSKEIINKYGLNCTDSGNGYTCSFNNATEKGWFCQATGLCK